VLCLRPAGPPRRLDEYSWRHWAVLFRGVRGVRTLRSRQVPLVQFCPHPQPRCLLL
jgi:hypothetical protein